MSDHTNELINETSPYLLQHAHNPVNWFAWSEKTLTKAKAENKPILVSIGYAACHWCHVMERESFEDEVTAKFMNENFINIKVDREERPDIDHIYMDAIQAITGSGGWPLNVFLTPEGKPFYGGTYFPPQRAFNRPSWIEVLQGIALAYREKQQEINAQAENLTEHLIQANLTGNEKYGQSENVFKSEKLDEGFKNIMKSADKEWGGFGKAPKFPQTFIIQFLIRYHHFTKNNEALDQATLSLDKMIEGGIYDQVGGGFSRYSTDDEWLVSHFEKMLYDNALLISVISEAYQLTKRNRYKEVIEETIEFVCREMLHSEGGFFSAIDADSEGIEGKYYIWAYNDIQKILGEEAGIFCKYYDITPAGNWEDKNILRAKVFFEKFSFLEKIETIALKNLLENGRKKLLEDRAKRVPPVLDDKIILGWNALMNTACSKAFAATGNEKYRQLAIKNMQFLLNKFKISDNGEFCHTWKNDIAKIPAFIDDYAYLIQALIHLQEITANSDWLIKAKTITEFVINNFGEDETGLFYYTKKDQKDIIIRKKEIYDGAVPSGNSIMAYNLYHLSILLDKSEWREHSLRMMASLGKIISVYPSSFGIWICLMQELVAGTHEIAIKGHNYKIHHIELLKHFIPHKVLMASDNQPSDFPLLTNKPVTDDVFIYLCKDFNCLQPVKTIHEFISLINRPGKA